MNLLASYEELLDEYRRLHDAINALDNIGFNNSRAYVLEQLNREDLNVFDADDRLKRSSIISEAIETAFRFADK